MAVVETGADARSGRPGAQTPTAGTPQACAPDAVDDLWTTIGGDSSASEHLLIGAGHTGLSGPLPVADLAVGSVGVAALAAAELATQRGASQRPARAAPSVASLTDSFPKPAIDPRGVGAAFLSERFLRRDGERSTGWAPLSGFFPARDGWVRTHANYDHHRRRLLGALGLKDGADAAALAARLGQLDALEIEQQVTEAGGLAIAVRTAEQWAATDIGRWLDDQPLLRTDSTGDQPPIELAATDGARPAAGVRVLDLTRVIAGPVATRTLAHLGADVLRVDSPASPEIAFQHIDTGFGKRSTLLDLADPVDRARFEELLASADVVIDGYRPGALATYGLDAAAIHARHPAIIVATLCAWGSSGPWSGRRGFDSLVQAASGIAEICRESPDGPPGVLPAQALDHATGYLIAAAVLRALTLRARQGGSWTIDASLAQTAMWLLRRRSSTMTGADDETRPPDASAWLAETPSQYGTLRHVMPPIQLAGLPRAWAHGPVIWGTSTPRWA